jgi:hypothetical protein
MFSKFTLSIVIRIEQRGPRGGKGDGITLSDAIEINGLDFMQVAGVVDHIHSFFESLKNARRQLPSGDEV